MVLVFFPPRLIETDPSVGDENAQMADAVECYTALGVVLVEKEEGQVKDVLKIVEFSRQFRSLAPKFFYSPSPSLPMEGPENGSPGFGFEIALQHIRGGFRMTRDGWARNGMFVEIQVPDEHSKMTLPYIFLCGTVQTCAPDAEAQTPPEISFRVPWIASQTDLLATDWRTSPFQGKELKVAR